DPSQVYRATTPSAAAAPSAPAATRERFEADALAVLALFDGQRSVEEVLLLSGLSDARALEIVARLLERGAIAPVSPGDAPAEAAGNNVGMSYRPFVASAPPEPFGLPAWLLACGAVVCSSLGALSVLLYTGALSSSPSPSDPGSSAGRASAPLPPAPASAVAAVAARCPRDMVWIEGGTFTMGSDSDAPALSLARPTHEVTLRGF